MIYFVNIFTPSFKTNQLDVDYLKALTCNTPLIRFNVSLSLPTSTRHVPIAIPIGRMREQTIAYNKVRHVVNRFFTNCNPREKEITVSWHTTATVRLHTACSLYFKPTDIPERKCITDI